MTTGEFPIPLDPAFLAAYNALVSGVDPIGVRLVSLHLGATALTPGEGEADAEVSANSPRWEARAGGFTAIQPFKVTGDNGSGARLQLELELAVDYFSTAEMTDALFEIFGRNNLPLNAHPFIRETVASLTVRAGWPPLILPAFLKLGRTDSTPASEPAPPPAGS